MQFHVTRVIVLILLLSLIYYRFIDDLGTIDLLNSLDAFQLNDLSIICRTSECVQCVSEFVGKCGRLSSFRFGLVTGIVTDADLVEMWTAIIRCKHMREVYVHGGGTMNTKRQCDILKETLTTLSQAQRDELSWRRVAMVKWDDHADITDLDEFNNLIPALNRN